MIYKLLLTTIEVKLGICIYVSEMLDVVKGETSSRKYKLTEIDVHKGITKLLKHLTNSCHICLDLAL